jgi:hypothetical protein
MGSTSCDSEKYKKRLQEVEAVITGIKYSKEIIPHKVT